MNEARGNGFGNPNPSRGSRHIRQYGALTCEKRSRKDADGGATTSRLSPLNDSGARIVIVGGGVIGLGVAYHLAKLGADDVLLIERNQLSSGTSWHAAGIVGPLRASLSATRLAIVADEVFPTLERETAQSTGYRRTGGFWLARAAERLVELRRIAAVGEMAGVGALMVERDEIAAALARRAAGAGTGERAGAPACPPHEITPADAPSWTVPPADRAGRRRRTDPSPTIEPGGEESRLTSA